MEDANGSISRMKAFKVVDTVLEDAHFNGADPLYFGGAIAFEAALHPEDLPISWHRGSIKVCKELGINEPDAECYKAMQMATHVVLNEMQGTEAKYV